MLRLIYIFCIGLLLLESCNTELPDRPQSECFLIQDDRWGGEFNMPYRAQSDTHVVLFQNDRGSAHLIVRKKLISEAETLMTYSLLPADSASNLFFIANPDDPTSCAISVRKGDVIAPGYTRNTGLSDQGFRWCNDCEFMLYSRKTGEEESCGPGMWETFKVPYSIGFGSSANFGWFEFQATPNLIRFRKKNFSSRCEELEIR